MSNDARRLIVARSFDRTLWSLIEALIREGFFLKACDIRKMARHTAGRNLRRGVALQATHPDLTRAPELDPDAGVPFACDIAVDECANGETAVTIKRPVAPTSDFAVWQIAHPAFAAITQAFEDRVNRVLDTIGPGGERRIAAA